MLVSKGAPVGRLVGCFVTLGDDGGGGEGRHVACMFLLLTLSAELGHILK